MRRTLAALLVAMLASCGSGSSTAALALPAEAQTTVDYLVSHARTFSTLYQQVLQALANALLDPAAAAAAGIDLQSTGGNGYQFTIPFDPDGDGTADGSLSGTATFDQAVEATGNTGLEGTIDAQIAIPGGATTTLDLHVSVGPDGILFSGTIGILDPPNGLQGTLTIDPTAPLRLRAATGGADGKANFCGASLEGDLRVELAPIAGPTTLLSGSDFFRALIRFLFSSSFPRLLNAEHGPDPGSMTPLPDTTLDLLCPASLQDWVGTFDMEWFCPPGEGGTESHTFTVTGPNTLRVSKLSSGSTEPTVFTATAQPGNPHVLTGEFTEGTPGNRYTETFEYTLSPDGRFFTQRNAYVLIEGPGTGFGGPCYGRAIKR